MSYHKRQESPASKPKRTAAQWAKQPLTNSQKATLSMAARAAWDVQQKAGLADGDFDTWRHEQTEVACGIDSLRDATNSHFRAIMAHFLRLAGREDEAAKLWAKTGRVAGSNEVHDTHENRESARAILAQFILGSGGKIHANYVAAIAKNKFGEGDVYRLTARQLQDLAVTVKARLQRK